MQVIGGSWLDEPQGQNIGDSSPLDPTKSVPAHSTLCWNRDLFQSANSWMSLRGLDICG